MLTFVEEIESNPLDRDARVAANLAEGDFFYHWMLSVGIVHADNPVWYNPNLIEGWKMNILPTVNNLETITIKQ